MSNPELRRNLWLEITPHRMLLMPLLLGLVFVMVGMLAKPPDVSRNLAIAGLGGFMLISFGWGTQLAAKAFSDELAERTWDWQRLSAISPWTITWGKLFGATAFTWYGGFFCLLVFLIYAPAKPFTHPIQTALTVVFLAITAHACALTLAVQLTRLDPLKKSSPVFIFFALLITSGVLSFRSIRLVVNPTFEAPIDWYGWIMNNANFVLASVVFFAVWALVGAYRTLCQALTVRTVPVVLLGFMATAALYWSGFKTGHADTSIINALTWYVFQLSLTLSYIMLCLEPSGPIVVRRLLNHLKLRQWRRAAEELPCWTVCIACALLSALLLNNFQPSGINAFFLPTIKVEILPITLMLIRDAGILMFFAAAAKPRRVVGSALIYIVMLNLVLPGALHALGAEFAAGLVLPPYAEGKTLQSLIALFHALIAWSLASRRIRDRWAFTRVNV
jgi:hypothetical protein